MRVRQRAYVAISSDDEEPAWVTARLGITPDRVSIRGSKRLGPPPIPRSHSWMLDSGLPDSVRLNEHFDALLDRLTPTTDRVAGLIADGACSICLHVVRYFEDGPEVEAHIAGWNARLPDGLELLGGQHRLLGFHLDQDELQRWLALGASISVDEYGDEKPE